MKKIAILFVMVFAFSLTQASNHAVVKNIANNHAILQASTMAIQGTNMQKTPVFQMTAASEEEMNAGHHPARTKRPKADKKPRVKKAKQHKDRQAKKEAREKNRQARKAVHHHNKTGHRHHKKNGND